MKKILVMMVAVVLVGCGTANKGPKVHTLYKDPILKRYTLETPEERWKIDPDANANIVDPFMDEKIRRTAEGINGNFAPIGKLTMRHLYYVDYIELRFAKFTEAGLKDLASLQNLTYLNLEKASITDAGLKELAKLKKLKDLYLFNTKITDGGLKELAKLQNLTKLHLGSTPITDAGLKELAKLKKLKELHVPDTKITDAGVAKLKKALPNCRIVGP